MIVYAIVNTVNGKMYIGQTIQKWSVRRNDHWSLLDRNCHENPYLQNAWNKYGEQSFQYFVVQECKDQLECDWVEIYWIETLRPNIYNLKSGGKDCFEFSAESIERIREAQRDRANKPGGREHLKEMSAKFWNRSDAKSIRSKDSKEMWNTCDNETRLKMLSNLDISPEQKSEISKKVWQSSEYRLKFEKNYGKVISPDGIVYEIQGLRKFSKKHNLDPSTLSKLCNGTYKQYKGWVKYG